jgi:hypothetical protein
MQRLLCKGTEDQMTNSHKNYRQTPETMYVYVYLPSSAVECYFII